jgi:putative membrane protein
MRALGRYPRGMFLAAKALVALIAVEHAWFAVLEMLLWTKPFGRKTFGTTDAFAKESAALAANQGLYNLFLVAGLVWSLAAEDPASRHLRVFFLGCVVVAGLFGGVTVNRRIAALPARAARSPTRRTG